MSILCRQVSLAQLAPNVRAHRRRWQMGIEAAIVTHHRETLGFIVPLEIFNSLPTDAVSRMPLRDLPAWLFQNRQGWLDGIMDGLILTWHSEEVLGFVHPRYHIQLPLAKIH